MTGKQYLHDTERQPIVHCETSIFRSLLVTYADARVRPVDSVPVEEVEARRGALPVSDLALCIASAARRATRRACEHEAAAISVRLAQKDGGLGIVHRGFSIQRLQSMEGALHSFTNVVFEDAICTTLLLLVDV